MGTSEKKDDKEIPPGSDYSAFPLTAIAFCGRAKGARGMFSRSGQAKGKNIKCSGEPSKGAGGNVI